MFPKKKKQGNGIKMDLAWLVILLTFLVGFALGKKVHGTVGMVASSVVGAAIYVLWSFFIVGPSAVSTFDIPTQLLMVTFGALAAVFGWLIGENYNFPKSRKTK